MPFLSSVGSFVAREVTSKIPIVGGTISNVAGDIVASAGKSSGSPGRSRPGNVLTQNPGEPSGEAFRVALGQASQAELSELQAAYENAVKDFTFGEAIQDPQFVLHGAWGGDDGKVKGGEVRLQKACVAILNRYKMGDAPLPFPAEEKKSPLQQTIDRAKEEAQKLPARVVGAVLSETEQSLHTSTEPVQKDIAKRKLQDMLPWIIGGGVLGFMLITSLHGIKKGS